MGSSLRAKRSNPSSRKKKNGLLRRFAPRNDGKIYPFVIARSGSDEAIQLSFRRTATWIASLALAMTENYRPAN